MYICIIYIIYIYVFQYKKYYQGQLLQLLNYRRYIFTEEKGFSHIQYKKLIKKTN